MDTEPYKEWISLYDEEVCDIWFNERKELKNAAMVLHIFQKELSRVKDALNDEMCDIRQQLKRKDQHSNEKKKPCSPTSPKIKKSHIGNKENRPSLNHSSEKSIPILTESPDLFRDLDYNINSTTVDESFNDLSLEQSPTINRNKRFSCKNDSKDNNTSTYFNLQDQILANISYSPKKVFKTPNAIDLNKDIYDCSIIDNTPEVKPKKERSGKGSVLFSKKKKKDHGLSLKNSTLTKYGVGHLKKKENVPLSKSNEVIVVEDDDVTYIDTQKSTLELTEMLELINRNSDESPKRSAVLTNQSTSKDTDGPKEITNIASGSKSSNKTDAKELETFIAEYDRVPEIVDTGPKYAHKTETIRGAARKKLPGWSCHECQNFYEKMDLSPKELEKKMNECSRHKSKFKPPEDTFSAFWDMSFRTQDSQK